MTSPNYTLPVLAHLARRIPCGLARTVINDLSFLRRYNAEHNEAFATGIHCNAVAACHFNLDVIDPVVGIVHGMTGFQKLQA